MLRFSAGAPQMMRLSCASTIPVASRAASLSGLRRTLTTAPTVQRSFARTARMGTLAGVVITAGNVQIAHAAAVREDKDLVIEDRTVAVFGSDEERDLLTLQTKSEGWIRSLLGPLADRFFTWEEANGAPLTFAVFLGVNVCVLGLTVASLFPYVGYVGITLWEGLVIGWYQQLKRVGTELATMHATRPFSSLPAVMRSSCMDLEDTIVSHFKDHFYFTDEKAVFTDYRNVNYRPKEDVFEFQCTVSTQRSEAARKMHNGSQRARGFVRGRIHPSNPSPEVMDLSVEFYPTGMPVKYPYTHVYGDQIFYVRVADAFEIPDEEPKGFAAFLKNIKVKFGDPLTELFFGFNPIRIPNLFKTDDRIDEALPIPDFSHFYEEEM